MIWLFLYIIKNRSYLLFLPWLSSRWSFLKYRNLWILNLFSFFNLLKLLIRGQISRCVFEKSIFNCINIVITDFSLLFFINKFIYLQRQLLRFLDNNRNILIFQFTIIFRNSLSTLDFIIFRFHRFCFWQRLIDRCWYCLWLKLFWFWSFKISRWLIQLLNSLIKLRPIIRKMYRPACLTNSW